MPLRVATRVVGRPGARACALRVAAALAVAVAVGGGGLIGGVARAAGAAPPDTEPDAGAGGEVGGDAAPPADDQDLGFERRLAEIAFGTYLDTVLGASSDEVSCTTPVDLTRGVTITCFAVVNAERLIVATTSVSGGSGRFEFQMLSDTPFPPPAQAALADAPLEVDEYGTLINQSSPGFVAQYLTDPRIAAVNTYEYDPGSLMVVLDLALAPPSSIEADDMAWANVIEFARVHWSAGQPFRDAGPEVGVGFRFVLDGREYESDFALMSQVADGSVSQAEWLAAVTLTEDATAGRSPPVG
jgi:hypothetical protein